MTRMRLACCCDPGAVEEVRRAEMSAGVSCSCTQRERSEMVGETEG